jgi:hypothetical protein
MTSNCLVFAVEHWLHCGGYIIFRKSHWGWWFHAIWSKDLKSFEEFHPTGKKKRRWFPPLIFKGYIRHSTVAEQRLS